ncbi:Biogenesis of lysosome-related organelles complex 1 subunit 2 [Apostasia shenzhenica]|uniref:Biogenesis of lysosome-related organelles complex 1 subunit 2 n=1 Tax=Apostasia shenzhenica TaxID=1088818 RepID=A0A2I0BC60_9ASPA|nr:Biogenesis of lysosome-related organelles complex 1 subunit 2 [Apostasia shenzhenica]
MSEERRGLDQEELANSLARLFIDVSAMIKGDLEGTNNQLLVLEKMNKRVAEEYNAYADVASGLRIFVEQLNVKSRRFDDYIRQIDAIEQQVTDFEAVISMLDRSVALLESRVESAYRS